ncbi:MAG: glycosyltransferase family 39 protein [Clostridia bacterium]|nr:glycosyltransferase family 39 protein [Clostridia bacterium]
MKNSFKRYALIAAAAIALLALVFFLFLRPSSTTDYGENLLVNGSFEKVDQKGLPEGWTLDAYNGLSGSVFDVVQDENGDFAAHIVNQIPKDARFSQEVSVEPNSLYRLHGFIKADAQDGRGANLSIKDIYLFTDIIYDTQGEWQEAVLYGRTGEDQHTVTIFVRLGGYSGESTGEAWFRDVSLCKVDGIPDGYSAPLWSSARSASDAKTDASEGTASMLLVFSSIAYVGLFILLCCTILRPRLLQGWRRIWTKGWTAVMLLLAAFALRIAIAALVPGYDVDIGCFRAWGIKMAESGPAGFYPANDPFSFCDYPPGYMWVLWLLGLAGNLLGTGLTEFMVKLPPIFADMAMCAVIYRMGKKRLPDAAALALSLLYAFNPLIMVTGAAWGQADALMTLLLVLAVLYAVEHRWKAALPLYMASVLFKPQALMFGPLGLLALVIDFLRALKDEKEGKAKLKDMGLGLAFTVITALAVALPFSIHLKWNWLITLYSKTMGRYAYATVNSCNLYFLLGKNWVSAGSVISGEFFVPFLAFFLASAPLAAAWLTHWKGSVQNALQDQSNRPRLYVLSGMVFALALTMLILSMLGSLTYASLGTVMIVYCVAVIAALYIFSHDAESLPVFGAAMLLLLFNTGSMMHERYLFPAVALLLLGYLLKKDVRILWLAVGVTIAGFLNVGCALDRNIRIGGAAGHLNAPAVSISSDTAILEYLSAALNVMVGFASLWLCSALSRGGAVEIVPENRPVSPLPKAAPQRKMTVRDWIIMASITVVYSVITFTNLGSAKAPQTAYVSQSPDEQIMLDLGEEHTFNMLYYGGIHQYQSDFTVEFSRDGTTFDQRYTADMPVGDCFKWKYLSYSSGGYPETVTARYVRITANNYNLTLFEVLFRDAETNEVIPAALLGQMTVREAPLTDPETGETRTSRQIVKDGNETAAYLADEPDSMEGDYPSWYNSTYFDEIYHARTAYEHLHQMQPYEYTHPPLGKVMMSWAIAIFGMTPFGWRFAGALAGVLMLPGMYLLGKLLIKRSWGGMACCALLALDLMHFTQTRIATIDSFVVLWIIWMVYFMLVWFFQEPFRKPLWKALIPLVLSGLCMGLGIASKWTGCYAGVVLALIFFWGVFRRWRLTRAAKKIPEKKRTEEEKAAVNGGKYLLITIASCFVFFILVPAIVYYCAYIPFFAYDGTGVTVKKIIQETERMFSYHSTPGLGMDHAFYSPWYEWPVIAKPMYYASNSFEPAGYHTTISAMGNPAVWWGGLLCILCLCGVWIKRHLQKDGTFTFWTEKNDPRPAIILLCYFVQLLPWILVPRGTYIYHYFPCVPFLAIAIVLSVDLLADTGYATASIPAETGEKTAIVLLAVILIAAAALFIAFFPYASGCLTPQSWLDAMRWFDRWLWY